MAKVCNGGTFGPDELDLVEANGGDLGASGPDYLQRFGSPFINPKYFEPTIIALDPTIIISSASPIFSGDFVQYRETHTSLSNSEVSATFEPGVAGTIYSVEANAEGFLLENNVLKQLQPLGANISVSIKTSLGIKTFVQSIPDASTEIVNVGEAVPETGSLRKHIRDRMLAASQTQIASDITKARFSTQDHDNQIYVPNDNCWAKAFDFSCESPWNSQDSGRRSGTLVSPRHFIFAAHYPLQVGDTIRFVSKLGEVVNRTVTQTANVVATDISVGCLDSDVPDYIKFAKVLPIDFTTKIPGGGDINPKIPVFQLDQEEKILAGGWMEDSSIASVGTPEESSLLAFHETIIGGDSGNPNLVPIDNDMVLLFCFLSAQEGPSIRHNTSKINTIMTNMGGGYQLSIADLSSFNNY